MTNQRLRYVGSKDSPFPHPDALLDFLKTDNPEQYVFRGQTRAYPGPLLPSQLRDRFLPFSDTDARGKWAGITLPDKDVRNQVEVRRRELEPQYLGEMQSDPSDCCWDITEPEYQAGFLEYFSQPFCSRQVTVGRFLREAAVPGLHRLFGDDVGALLAQQFGLTSSALDASTDPAIALFFATHAAPFYHPVGVSDELGVVYRWPRNTAMIAADVVLPLEQDYFGGCVSSLRNYIEQNRHLRLGPTCPFEADGRVYRDQFIVADGPERNLSALPFPRDAFANSRLGRQKAALLWPKWENIVAAILDDGDHSSEEAPQSDHATLVADIMYTHHGESFYFRHSEGKRVADYIDKYMLWPSLMVPNENLDLNAVVSLAANQKPYVFEDIYLEFMLRFFSSCSQFRISFAEILREAAPDVIPFPESAEGQRFLRLTGTVHGVIDAGFALHPLDTKGIADRLSRHLQEGLLGTAGRESDHAANAAVVIPTLRHIPSEHVVEFKSLIVKALQV